MLLQVAELMHFTTNLHDYAMHRVVHVSWRRLLVAVNEAHSLEDVARAHRAYLDNVCAECLLPSAANSTISVSDDASPRDSKLTMKHIIVRLLDCALVFRDQCSSIAFGVCRSSSEGVTEWASSEQRKLNRLENTFKTFFNTKRFLLKTLQQKVQGGGGHFTDLLLRLDFNYSDLRKKPDMP